jgi:hypothetical protein
MAFWGRQTVVYVSALIAMKLCVVLLFAIVPELFAVGEWLLTWTGNGGAVQVILCVSSNQYGSAGANQLSLIV